jgi:hypothetical protein
VGQQWDTFFYYGLGDLQDEIKHDILNGTTTSKNKLFFNRADSAGVNDFENYPSGLAIQIGLQYSIVKWLGYRNTYIGDGTEGRKERRLATSQNEIKIENDINKGNVDISIFYIPFADFNQNKVLAIPIGV